MDNSLIEFFMETGQRHGWKDRLRRNGVVKRHLSRSGMAPWTGDFLRVIPQLWRVGLGFGEKESDNAGLDVSMKRREKVGILTLNFAIIKSNKMDSRLPRVKFFGSE